MIIIIIINHFESVDSVSYPNQKVRFTWDEKSGVVLNPELKLLQYNLGQPLELAESFGYMPEKHGNVWAHFPHEYLSINSHADQLYLISNHC